MGKKTRNERRALKAAGVERAKNVQPVQRIADDHPVDLAKDRIEIPVKYMHTYHNRYAHEQGHEWNWCYAAGGGIGDIICAEPTLRYLLSKFPQARITLLTHHPDVFSHLHQKLHAIHDPSVPLDGDKYRIFTTGFHGPPLLWEFIEPSGMNSVDFVAMSVLRRLLDPVDRQIILNRAPANHPFWKDFIRKPSQFVFLHPGLTWTSRTFPEDWWVELTELLGQRWTPVLVGKHHPSKHLDFNGVFDFKAPEGVVDLRNELDLRSMISFMANADKLVTNDSSPVHMAAGGDARIAFGSTAKPGWMLKHWRHGVLGQGMFDFAHDYVLRTADMNPCWKTAADKKYREASVEFIRSAITPADVLAPKLFELWKEPGYALS